MPKINAETATGPVETDAPEGKKLVLVLEDAGVAVVDDPPAGAVDEGTGGVVSQELEGPGELGRGRLARGTEVWLEGLELLAVVGHADTLYSVSVVVQ